MFSLIVGPDGLDTGDVCKRRDRRPKIKEIQRRCTFDGTSTFNASVSVVSAKTKSFIRDHAFIRLSEKKFASGTERSMVK